MEVVGGSRATGTRPAPTSGGGIAGGVRSKIRHHGAVKASAYTGGPNLSGAGVPMRLSASEVDEAESDDDKAYDMGAHYHQRNGSGRSSLTSGQRRTSYGTTAAQNHPIARRQASNGSTPPMSTTGYSPVDPSAGHEEETPSDHGETPVPDMYSSRQGGDYFDLARASGPGNSGGSGGSGSSEERGFGDVGGLPRRQDGKDVLQKGKTSEELRRRGSVDDRTMTMSAGRLFVANPDLSD